MRTNSLIQQLEFIPHDSIILLFWTGCLRALLFILIWWILTDGVIASWWVGVPVVLLTTIVSMMLFAPCSCSLTGFIRIIPFFLWHSLCGAADVARRALHPQLPISPGLYRYRWHLTPGLAQVFMADMVSLLPGTLSIDLHNDYLYVHVLDMKGTFISDLSILEEYVAKLFGIDLMLDRSNKNETF